MKQLVAVLFISLLSACGADNTNTSADSSNEETSDQPVTITFIHMNDLHANLISHSELFSGQDGGKLNVTNAGGIIKMASKIKSIRQAHPETSILMNIGDTFHGTGEALFSNGNAIIDPINQLNIDIGVPGNWDYAYGPIVSNARFGNLTNQQVLRPNYDLLAANATYKIPDMFENNPLAQTAVQNVFNYTAGQAFLPGTKIIELQGIKVGFIGLTSDIVEKMHPLLAFNIDFLQGKQNYLDLLNEQSGQLKDQGAEIVVVMSELGLQKDWALAKELDSDVVQIFFSAHTHERTEQPLIASNGTLVVESGNDSFLGQMDVTIINKKMTDFAWQLHRLDETVSDDPNMAELVAQARAPFLIDVPNISIPQISLSNASFADLLPKPSEQILQHSLDSIIYKSKLPLDRYSSLESHFNNFFSDLLRLDNQSDIAMTPGFRFNAIVIPSESDFEGDASNYQWQSETPEILNGDLKISDVYRLFPAPYSVATGQTSVANLKLVIEGNLEEVYSPDIFNQGGGWVEGYSGLDLQLDLSQPEGQRIVDLKLTDNQLSPTDDTLISVTGCARPFDLEAETTLCSYPGFENVTPLVNPQTGSAYASADYFIDQLINNNVVLSEIKERKSITDISAQEQWPNSVYVQPLEGVGSSQ